MSAWIDTISAEAIAPERVRNALYSILGRWPSDFPLLETLGLEFPTGVDSLGHLFSVSTIAAERLANDPEAFVWLAQPEICSSSRGPKRMRLDFQRLKGDAGFDPRFRALRRAKGREMLRIALREVAGLSSVEQTTLELSHLAELCVREVCDGWMAELTKRWGTPNTDFAVLGMGKFGGQELNYSSDIDVIFFFGENGEVRPGFPNSEFFTRLAQKISETFAVSGEAGTLFRIDLRLRPEGDTGPLVRSMESMENYYAGYGETWERMALIKARGVGGSDELAYEFSQRLQAFIYPRTVSADVLEEIGAIKGRIEREIVGEKNLTRNVKLGSGGIREIEFVAQALQLLHGARNAFLQDRSTLKVLRGLQQLDLIPHDEMERLTDAYRFLRTVEHRLQIEKEAQTHTLPESQEDLARISASLGYGSVAEFRSALAAHTTAVRQVFDKVFQGRTSGSTTTKDISFFASPEKATTLLDQLSHTQSSGHVSPRTKKLFTKLEPLLLEELSGLADPDTALARFTGFVDRYGIRGLLFETLVQNPKLLDLLMRLFDSSRFLTDITLRRPQLIEEIARTGVLGEVFGMQDYCKGLQRNEENLPWMDWVRVYRRSQILRIALRDILGFANMETVHAEFAALADACVSFVADRLELSDRLTVVAMGKFGGQEVSYGCDLDVVFVGTDPADGSALIKAMTTTTAEGIVFPMDARLRPEGQSGVLVVPVSRFEEYFSGRAQIWEAQSLTKVRPLFGPACEEYLAFAQSAWRRFGQRADLIPTIKEMHHRVASQRSSGQDLLDFKTGVGGLMELEFYVQARQMREGLWEPNTLRAMERMDLPLREECLFLRRIEAVLRRVENSSVSSLPKEESAQRMLIHRLGYTDASDFWAQYRGARGNIHFAFEALE